MTPSPCISATKNAYVITCSELWSSHNGVKVKPKYCIIIGDKKINFELTRFGDGWTKKNTGVEPKSFLQFLILILGFLKRRPDSSTRVVSQSRGTHHYVVVSHSRIQLVLYCFSLMPKSVIIKYQTINNHYINRLITSSNRMLS